MQYMISIPVTPKLITVLGPTAGGKTSFAANLSHRIGGEIISADSRQVYKRMNLGTGKDYEDYIVDGERIPVHLIDIAEPGDEYNVFEFQKDFVRAFRNITGREKMPILCGGTGLYIEAVLKGYKLIRVPVNHVLRKFLQDKSMVEMTEILKSYKKLHNTTDTENRKRLARAIEIEEYYRSHPKETSDYPDIHTLILGVKFDRVSRRSRITERLKSRLENGMIEEVRQLLDSGIRPEKLIHYGLEYKYITMYIIGQIDYETMFQKLNTSIHQFAKRQMTWFRSMERQGTDIHWLDGHAPMKEKIGRSLEVLNKYGLKV